MSDNTTQNPAGAPEPSDESADLGVEDGPDTTNDEGKPVDNPSG